MLKLRGNAAFFALVVIVGALAPVSALAEENPVSEVTGVAGDTTGTAEQAAEETTGTAEQAAEDATGTAEQAAEDATGTAEQAAEETTGTVEQAAEETTGTVEQAAEDATGTAQQTADNATGTAQQTTDNATGTAETSGSAKSSEDSGRITKRASTDAAGPDIRQDAFLMPGTRGGVAPAGARTAFGVSRDRAYSWNRLRGNDSDKPLETPSQQLAEVVQAGNQITAPPPRNKQGEKFDLTEWLPGWLPSLLAVTGFSVLLLTGIAVFFIHGGVGALAWTRRRVRPEPDHAGATLVASP